MNLVPHKAIILAILGVSLMLASCETGLGGMQGRSNRRTDFTSNGERIYFTGNSGSGMSIRARGGPGNASAMGEFAVLTATGKMAKISR